MQGLSLLEAESSNLAEVSSLRRSSDVLQKLLFLIVLAPHFHGYQLHFLHKETQIPTSLGLKIITNTSWFWSKFCNMLNTTIYYWRYIYFLALWKAQKQGRSCTRDKTFRLCSSSTFQRTDTVSELRGCIEFIWLMTAKTSNGTDSGILLV